MTPEQIRDQVAAVREDFYKLHKSAVPAEIDYRALSIALSRMDECYLWLEAAIDKKFCVPST